MSFLGFFSTKVSETTHMTIFSKEIVTNLLSPVLKLLPSFGNVKKGSQTRGGLWRVKALGIKLEGSRGGVVFSLQSYWVGGFQGTSKVTVDELMSLESAVTFYVHFKVLPCSPGLVRSSPGNLTGELRGGFPEVGGTRLVPYSCLRNPRLAAVLCKPFLRTGGWR